MTSDGNQATKAGNELARRGYSEEEVSHLYEFGCVRLENGRISQAETVFQGLIQVAPDFAPAWLGLAYVFAAGGKFDDAVFASRQALRIDTHSHGALLLLISCLLSTGDYHAAGTHLGEVGERIDAGLLEDPDVIRFFRVQLARFQNRGALTR